MDITIESEINDNDSARCFTRKSCTCVGDRSDVTIEVYVARYYYSAFHESQGGLLHAVSHDDFH